MRYLIILGQNPELSLAEIEAVYPVKIIAKTNEAAVLECPHKIDLERLGGAPKIAEVLGESSSPDKLIIEELLSFPAEKKVFFGLSFYGSENKRFYNQLGKNIKQGLQENGYKVRWAVSREIALSSVYIKTNKLLTRGADFCVLFTPENSKIFIAKTIQVQDFASYGFRDMNRPARDLVSGMTPPKLAKMLINLAGIKVGTGRDLSLLDPFCGSGTFLMEAGLLGFKEIYGSDVNAKAVADSQKNLEWLAKNYKKSPSSTLPLDKGELEGVKIKQCDVSELKTCWSASRRKKFDCVVTEPFLGPPIRGELKFDAAKKSQQELNENYKKYLAGISSVMEKGGALVLIAPAFFSDGKELKLNLEIKQNGFEAVREPILYRRPDQKVGREIYILKKI